MKSGRTPRFPARAAWVGRNGGTRGVSTRSNPWGALLQCLYARNRDGQRIESAANPQDIFVPLYNHQIPPGAGQVIHYDFTVPEDLTGPLTVEVKVQYRKFDNDVYELRFRENVIRIGPQSS